MDDLLSDLLTQFSPTKVAWILNNDPNPVTTLTLRQLKRLWSKSPDQARYSISELYLHILTKTTENSISLLIPLANDSLLAAEHFKGTEISDELEYRVFILFSKFQETHVLGYNEFYSVNQVTEKFKSDLIKPKLVEIANRITEGDHYAMQDLSNLMCSFSSPRALFYTIEKEFDEILESFKTVRSLQIFVQILNFLNTFLVESCYSVDNTLYRPAYLRYYRVHKKVFNTLWKIVNIVAQADIVVSQNLIKIVPKFWNVFSGKRMKMLPDLVKLLRAIQEEKYVDSLKMAENFIYDIFTDPKIDSALKNYLKSELKDLFTGSNFCHQEKPAATLSDLKIKNGFPLLTEIEAGSKFQITTKVSPGCILYCAFMLESHTISFSIKSDSQVFCSESQISTVSPLEKKILMQEESLVKIEWDNSYSWVNKKVLRYRVLVLHPDPPVTQDANLAYGVLEEDSLVLFTTDKREEHFSHPEPSQGILEFLVKYNKSCLNLVICSEAGLGELRVPGLVMGVDIELAAKYAYCQLKDKKIAVVSNSPYFRSCLVINGKVVKGLRGPTGCIKNITEFDVYIEYIISKIPSTLVFFRVTEPDHWANHLASKGISVNLLDIDVEHLAIDLRKLVN